MALFFRYKNRILIAEEAGFCEEVFSLGFLPYRTITFLIPPDPCIAILKNIKHVYIINFMAVFMDNIKGKSSKGATIF